MTEEIAATPGWVDERLDHLFAALPSSSSAIEARTAYSACLASSKAPGASSDLLGTEFAACRPALHSALMSSGVAPGLLASLDSALESLEAELASSS